MTIKPEELPNEDIIAIDGTSGSGKSTLARGLGKELGLAVLETGSIYRAIALLCIENNVDIDDEDRVSILASELNFTYEGYPEMDGKNISQDITRHDVALNVSHVAKHPKVREVVTLWTRSWIVDHKGGVVEGRDITSVVAPNAKVKVFVDAPEAIRTARRTRDKQENHEEISSDKVAEVIALRDQIDSNRTASPLIKVEGVYEIDSSSYSPEDMISIVANLYRG